MVKLPDFLRGYLLRPAPDYVLARSLAANAAESFTVPTGATGVMFSCVDNFYANTTTTATVPGDVTDGTASELNPVGYQLYGITTISVISPAACVITAAFYS